MIMSGYPFAGDPLSGLWYPPGWLALLFPLPLGINLVTWLHIGIGSLSLYYFLQKLGVRKEIALIFSLCFALMPKIFAHFGAGHITYIYSVCLTPLLMNAELERTKVRQRIYLPTIVLSALILLADIRWFPFALIAWIITPLLIPANNFGKLDGDIHSPDNFPGNYPARVIKTFGDTGIAVLLSTPFILPFIEFLTHSSRLSMRAGENLVYSLPPARLLGLILPQNGGFAEWVIYPGLSVIFLIGTALFTRRRNILIPTGLFIASLIWSLGSNIPIIGRIESLPLLNLIRVPPRVMFLGDLMAIIAGAMTLEWIFEQKKVDERKKISLILVCLFGFSMALDIGISFLSRHILDSTIRILVMNIMIFSCYLLLIREGYNQKTSFLLISLTVISLFDLILLDVTQISTKDSNTVLATNMVEIFEEQKDEFRVYSPTYSITQDFAIKENIQLSEGVNPMQVSAYAKYLENASGIHSTGYSVILPSMTGEKIDNIGQYFTVGNPDSDLLGKLNVRYLLVDKEIPDQNGWELVIKSNGIFLYKNLYELPRVFLLDKNSGIITGKALITKYTPNEIQINLTNGEGDLVLSEIYYPGWKAWVDGKDSPIQEYLGLFRMVQISPTSTNVTIKYEPFSVIIGLVISFCTLIIICLINIKQNAHR